MDIWDALALAERFDGATRGASLGLGRVLRRPLHQLLRAEVTNTLSKHLFEKKVVHSGVPGCYSNL